LLQLKIGPLAARQPRWPLLEFTFLNDNLVALPINSLQLSGIGKSETVNP
jgi:hypothetical protein